MNLNVHAILQLSSRGIPCHISNSCTVHSIRAWELWVFLLPHRCLTNDADQNRSSPECRGQVNDPIKGVKMVHVFKRWCMINRYQKMSLQFVLYIFKKGSILLTHF